MQIKGVKPLMTLAFLLAASAVPAVAQQGGGGGGRPMMGPPLQLTSSAFADGTTIPDKYTCSPDGKSMTSPANMTSPPLAWTNAPAGTQSFVLLLHDPDAHARKAFDDITHWMIFNIPGDATSLPEGVKADSTVGVQAANVTGQPMFFGPCAPAGPAHHYTFELFALDTKLDLQKGASRDDVQKAMDGHVLGGTVLIGLFHHDASFHMGPPPRPQQ
ncbi:MAG TPA: YbhB/YbcL family Raf kinase inhibitor-like protein [Candidatus Baltobacteraceae bacterium]|jgi:Raf kinase inhibitor-like YbhB/YbcL family protein|nr:YbhB/YbcL family Raf kinase inhibitor-like protein [Candidatus Baltobacteraceae bacterium]